MWPRVPGLDRKLSEAWAGPLEVLKRLNAVNYKVRDVSGKGKARVVHINNLKKFVEREERIARLTVVADEMTNVKEEEGLLRNRCDGFNQRELNVVLKEFADVLDEAPGSTDTCDIY